MRLAFLFTVVVVACSSSGVGGPNEDGGDNGQDGAGTDASQPEAAPLSAATSIVFVDGLVNGVATGVDGKSLTLADVRVCVLDVAKSTFTSEHALPYDTAMPLTNYPGIRQGSGLDLGSVPLQVRLDIYSTAGLESDAAWSPTTHTCDVMKCAQGGLPCEPHVSFTVSPVVGSVNVIALVDDPDPDGGFGVKLAQASFTDAEFGGAPNALWGTVVELADWHNGATIAAMYGDPTATTGDKPILQSPIEISPDISTELETHGIRFDATGGTSDHFGQTLDSIAYVANPAVAPPVFYDVRENFVFALVGDPNDPAGVNDQGGRNPQFNRRGLHIAAVPYATPHAP